MSDCKPMECCGHCKHFDPTHLHQMQGTCKLDNRIQLITDICDGYKGLTSYSERQRPPKDVTWMEIAWSLSMQGSCWKLGVGCLILNAAGRVVATGWNGVEEGQPHCTPETCVQENNHCVCCIHAEDNALYQAGLYGAQGGTMYITHQPCFRCSRLIVRGKLARVVYDTPYKEDSGIIKLQKRGIVVDRLPLRSAA